MTNDVILFLAVNTLHNSNLKNELSQVFESAGMSVRFYDYKYSTENNFKNEIAQLLPTSTCSVHLLEPSYGIRMESDNSISAAKYQFFEAKKVLEKNPDFKIFVWHIPQLDYSTIELDQKNFINEVRNNVTKNIIFTTASSSIQFTEDIRSAMKLKSIKKYDVRIADIFFIANELDESYANQVLNKLDKNYLIEKLFIIQDSEINYPELCSQQIKKSRLTVIYFKKSGDWALSFTNQIWKIIGGALSNTSVLLIGDENPASNQNKKVKAPKVVSNIVSDKLIPIEIQNQFERLKRQ